MIEARLMFVAALEEMGFGRGDTNHRLRSETVPFERERNVVLVRRVLSREAAEKSGGVSVSMSVVRYRWLVDTGPLPSTDRL